MNLLWILLWPSKKFYSICLGQSYLFVFIVRSTCTSLIMQVLELYGSQWSSPASPVNPSSLESGKKLPEGNSGLNTDATPFVPSEPLCLTETFYGLQVMQQPVTCAGEYMRMVPCVWPWCDIMYELMMYETLMWLLYMYTQWMTIVLILSWHSWLGWVCWRRPAWGGIWRWCVCSVLSRVGGCD